MSTSNGKTIPIMRPLLPEYRYIEPYLKKIDKNRWYSNLGPLVHELEERFPEVLELEKGTVLTVSNGTSALIATLRALDIPRDSFCLVPSWTFQATPAAAVASGLIPYFIDVDEKTWALDPAYVKNKIRKVPGRVGAIIVVSPFGAPIPTKVWDDFTSDTDIPVIIDAAAGFDSVSTVPKARPGKSPIMISLHATKVLGIGEGGIMIFSDKDLLQRTREITNFGFNAARNIRLVGTNDKMSEYQAAIGMAALDLWPQKREVWLRLKRQYIKAFEKHFSGSIASPWLLSDSWASSVCNVKLPEKNVEHVIKRLAENKIEAKRWWTRGCHYHPAYAKYQQFELPVTETLGDSVIGLPFSIDMPADDIDYVVATLRKVI